MKIFIPRYDFRLRQIVADEASLLAFLNYVKAYGAVTVYTSSSMVEMLKTAFYSQTNTDLIFTEIENDNLVLNMNKYSVLVQQPRLETVIVDLV